MIQLLPDDDPQTFYQKLSILPESSLAKQVQRFEKYARYAQLLKFHQVALRRSALNIRLAYNDRYGWHTSACLRSLRDEDKYVHLDKCTCEEDLSKPNDFFDRVEHEMTIRCKLCKRYIPEWEEVVPLQDVGVRRENERHT